MQGISGARVRQGRSWDRGIVERLAELGYQLEPEAFEMICRYSGSKDELLRRIISSTDRSVVVIGLSEVSCHLPNSNPLPGQAATVAERAPTSLASPSRVPSGPTPSSGPAGSSGSSQPTGASTSPGSASSHMAPSTPGVSSISRVTPSPRPPLTSSNPSREKAPSPREGTFVSPAIIEPSVGLECDITGRSTCVGEYEDFVFYFRDRYARIREILSRRLSSRPVESLGRGSAGREVSVIGMVMEVRNTAKGNRVIEIEDPTGMLTAVVAKDSEIYEQSGHIITDEVIGITGTSDGNGRLFVKSILWPDMPNQTAKLEAGHGQVLLLSDLHVGSKYFMADSWQRFLEWLNSGPDDPSGLASQVQYMVIAGDLVDGIGIYPGQERDLEIMDIYEQYRAAAEWLNGIRRDIKIIIAPGNHDIVRQAEPQPSLPLEVSKYFRDDILFVGNPAWVTCGSTSILVYHGRSIDDLVLRLPGISYAAPEKAMIEMLKRRHLSPIYGSRVSIAPEHEDHYVISRPPAILHCGHVHTVGIARYKGVTAINSGTWQSQTDFQKKMNIQPVAGVVPMVDLATMKVRKLIFS